MPPPTLALVRAEFATAIGTMLVVFDSDEVVRAIDWDDHEPRMRRLIRRHYGQGATSLATGQLPSPIRHTLADYFDGDLAALDRLRVRSAGTPFQEKVWRALRAIAPGSVTSYGELAADIGRPSAVRAVGLANGANPIGVAVPCHRVVGKGGALTGYGGGLFRKQWLLAHEGVPGFEGEKWS